MESEIAADWPLDFVKFQILSQNRYEAYICSNEEEEMVGEGPVDQLLEHLSNKMDDQLTQGSRDIFKLELPDTDDNRAWFTKATLMRFLQLVGSSDRLKKCVAISNEMSQLDEARKFHLSLYSQAEDGVTPSDNSKNELLRAIDSRLAALTEELVSSFKSAAGDTLALQEMLDLHKFCQHFGAVDVRNMLSKLSEASRKIFTDAPVDKKKSPVPFISKHDFAKKTGGNIKTSVPFDSNKAVKYNASPAKAAKMERQQSSSSESEDSSFSSENDDEEPPSSAERSRAFIRSATPRRSASPMRRIQIGRSGSRRTPAVMIKSLAHFPARERVPVLSHRDAGDDKLEEPEEANKKTEVNVTRISVQDAISLFESKQKDQIGESQKKSGTENLTNANRTVLRRWSAGMGESRNFFSQHLPENIASEGSPKAVEEDGAESSVESDSEKPGEVEVGIASNRSNEAHEGSEANEAVPSNPSNEGDVAGAAQIGESNEKLDSAEWSRQKEAELNQMLMKFAEYNQINLKNTKPDNNNRRKSSSLLERKGGLSKERKDEKPVKKAVKQPAKVKPATKQKRNQDNKAAPKAENSPLLRASNVVAKKKNNPTTTKTQNVNKVTTTPLVLKPTKEPPKPVVAKRAPPKSAPVPATRKSWPSSSPSPRTTPGTLTLPGTKLPSGTPTPRTAGTPTPRTATTTPRQKPQLPASLSKPAPQSERSRQDVKKVPVDSKKVLKKVDDNNKSRVVPKTAKTTKTKPKPVVGPKEDASGPPAKAVVRKKVAKKSSVVPLEAKPEDRKVKPKSQSTGQKVKVPARAEEIGQQPVSESRENVETTLSDTPHLAEEDPVVEARNVLENETEGEEKSRIDGENEVSDQAPADQIDEEIVEKMSKSSPEVVLVQVEGTEPCPPFISPSAWVESDEQEQEPSISNGKSSSGPSPAGHDDVEGSSGTRVRHSLSQMLLEESSEPEVVEWGNAENPPTMVYQKDAPKGLKRLLKFARKNKGEANGSLWSSPYASEGEDDGDECRSLGKKNSDNLLKVALHSKNYAEGFLSDSEPLSARSNVSNSSARSSKGSRSFFSLSAFRGNKG